MFATLCERASALIDPLTLAWAVTISALFLGFTWDLAMAAIASDEERGR